MFIKLKYCCRYKGGTKYYEPSPKFEKDLGPQTNHQKLTERT